MNTPAVAQNLASKGRNGDTTLVHMTPDEVQGLQALAMAQGGSLTINPETGLPEASFLSDTFKAIAPTLIGAGLTYFSGGAINPYMAAGIVGVGEGLRKDDLGAGIMAGLGAYGGAGMVKGLAGMGAAQAGQVLPGGVDTTKLSQLGGGMVKNTATAGGTNALGIAQGGVNEAFRAPITGSVGASGATTNSLVGSGAQIPGMQGGVSQAIQPIQSMSPTSAPIIEQGTSAQGNLLDGSRELFPNQQLHSDGTTTFFDLEGQGIRKAPIVDKSYGVGEVDKIAMAREGYAPSFRQNIDTGIARLGEEGGLTAFKDSYVNAMGGPKRALLGGAGVLGSVADGYGAFDYKPMELAEAETDDYGYEGPYLPAERNVRFRGRDAILGGEGREFKFFDSVNPVPNVRTAAHGGLMSAKKMAGGGDIYTNTMEYIIPRDEYGKKIPSSELFEEKAEPFTIPRDEDGNEIPMDLKRMIKLLDARKPKKMAVGGRYLDGPGDGVSDSIPATVDGDQPVMLSEGEYIIPAEVVSAVGNGSSDAGAEKFTKLVDTIMAKTRRVAKGKPNGADKLLKGLVPQTA